MTEAVSTCLICESLLEFLKTLPWCKQVDDTLVAVHRCTAEMIVAFGDHEVKVYPGGMNVKMNKSWLAHLQQMNAEGTPVPLLLVWRPAGIEIWYRRHQSNDFPYDMWMPNSVAEAYERERVLLPAEHGGAKYHEVFADLVAKSNACPPQIPKQ